MAVVSVSTTASCRSSVGSATTSTPCAVSSARPRRAGGAGAGAPSSPGPSAARPAPARRRRRRGRRSRRARDRPGSGSTSNARSVACSAICGGDLVRGRRDGGRAARARRRRPVLGLRGAARGARPRRRWPTPRRRAAARPAAALGPADGVPLRLSGGRGCARRADRALPRSRRRRARARRRAASSRPTRQVGPRCRRIAVTARRIWVGASCLRQRAPPRCHCGGPRSRPAPRAGGSCGSRLLRLLDLGQADRRPAGRPPR